MYISVQKSLPDFKFPLPSVFATKPLIYHAESTCGCWEELFNEFVEYIFVPNFVESLTYIHKDTYRELFLIGSV